MTPPLNILITGCPRSGTSLLTLLMSGFHDVVVFDKKEINPKRMAELRREHELRGHVAIKRPVGAGNIHEDYKASALKRRLFGTGNLATYLRQGWKIIYCIRDGRDVLSSRHSDNRPDEYFCGAQHWIQATRRLLPLVGQTNLQLVRYEWLATSPGDEMARIASFLQLPYDPHWIDEFHRSKRDGDFTFAERPVSTGSIGRWKRAEHSERVREEYASHGQELDSLLIALGYPPGGIPGLNSTE